MWVKLFDLHVSIYRLFVNGKIVFTIGWFFTFFLANALLAKVMYIIGFPSFSLVSGSLLLTVGLAIQLYHLYYAFEILNVALKCLGLQKWSPEEKLEKMSRGDTV